MKIVRACEAVGMAQSGLLSWHETVRCEVGEYSPVRLWFAQQLADQLPHVFDFAAALMMDTSKKGVKALIAKVNIEQGGHTAGRLIDLLFTLSTDVFTRSGASLGMDDLKVLNDITRDARLNAYREYVHDRDHEKFSATLTGIVADARDVIMGHTELPIVELVHSGSRGNYSQLSQLAICKGAIVNAAGRLEKYPVFHSLYEGLNQFETFSATKASRPSVSQSKTEIGKSGYLTSRLVKATRDLTVTEHDCGTTRGIQIPKKVAAYRYTPQGILLEPDFLRSLPDGPVWVRSPVTCEAVSGCCAKCYGYSLDFNEPAKIGYAIGVASGQALGEPTTQMMLRTFHTSSVGSIETVEWTAPFDGEVDVLNPPPGAEDAQTPVNPFTLFIVRNGTQAVSYPIHHAQISRVRVESGQPVTAGQPVVRFKRFMLGIGEQVGSISKSFEMERPQQPALMAGHDGLVAYSLLVNSALVQILDADDPSHVLDAQPVVNDTEFLFNSGERVKAGDKLTVGLYDFKALYKTVDRDQFAQTFVNSLFDIYDSNGASINCRDIEVILSVMMSYRRVEAVDNPDEVLMKGDMVPRAGVPDGVTVSPVIMGLKKCIQESPNFVAAASAGWVKKAFQRSLTQDITLMDGTAASRLAAGKLIQAGLTVNVQYLDSKTTEPE